MTQVWTGFQLFQNNDETVKLVFSDPASSPENGPYSLSGLTLNFYLKPSADTPDSDPSVVKLSTGSGEIVVTDAANGLATVTIAKADLPTAGTYFARVDAVQAGVTKTAGFGPVTITNL